MTMSSDPGYVPSSGWTEAILVSADAVADCAGEEEALWLIEGEKITPEDLEDVKVSTRRRGVCNYEYSKGIMKVPEGMAVVQKEMIDICTRDQVYRRAWIVNEESLVELYRQRAKRYKELINEFLEKKQGFADLRKEVR